MTLENLLGIGSLKEHPADAAVGAIVPSFYFRALEFFEQFGEPLLEAPKLLTQNLDIFGTSGDI
jgi:hypothetical protein